MNPTIRQRPHPVCTVAAIRRLEAAAFAQTPPPDLMERAGLAAAAWARRLLGDRRRLLVLAGPGNNGGDALVAARHLRAAGLEVAAVFCGRADALPADAAAALAAWRAVGGAPQADLPERLDHDLVIDGLFGIGLSRQIDGVPAVWIRRVNASGRPVLALDIPSGLHADTGRILGECIRADHTLSFIALKPGLLTRAGPDMCGTIQVESLGLEPDGTHPGIGHVVDDAYILAAIPRRRRDSHKGTYGTLVMVGGAPGMAGAALLAARAALLAGTGRVHVAQIDPEGLRVDPAQPELMLHRGLSSTTLAAASAVCAGPGMGAGTESALALQQCIEQPLPLLLDADALNLLAGDAGVEARVRARVAPTVLTPHPAEAARLLGCDTAATQDDRLAAALALAERYRAAVVLKGAGSVCATPDGRWHINTSGNPGMAVAGMGDVLSGIVGALLAQGCEPALALRAGVRLHGLAGDAAAFARGGMVGISASEVALLARDVANRIVTGGQAPAATPHPGYFPETAPSLTTDFSFNQE
jgi:hydroxyethylthiazole kinase-like uncharacterized protein yjeF